MWCIYGSPRERAPTERPVKGSVSEVPGTQSILFPVMGLTKANASWASQEYGKLLMEDGEPLTFGEFLDRVTKPSGVLTAGSLLGVFRTCECPCLCEESMLLLRGSNQTTVKDLVTLRRSAGCSPIIQEPKGYLGWQKYRLS